MVGGIEVGGLCWTPELGVGSLVASRVYLPEYDVHMTQA